MAVLKACRSCRRHVRAAEAICPFCSNPCGNELPPHGTPVARATLTRAAMLFAGASVAACAAEAPNAELDASGDAGTDGSELATDAGSVVPMYGSSGCDVSPAPSRELALGAVVAGAALVRLGRRRAKKRDG